MLREGGRKSVVTQGGAKDGLLLRREGWEVVVIVNTTSLIGFFIFYPMPLQQDKTFCLEVISHIMHLVKVWNKKILKV